MSAKFTRQYNHITDPQGIWAAIKALPDDYAVKAKLLNVLYLLEFNENSDLTSIEFSLHEIEVNSPKGTPNPPASNTTPPKV